MRRIDAILAAAFTLVSALAITGCAAKKSINPAQITGPPTPTAPASVKLGREPLSIPQTQVQLPPPQPPLNPEALAIPEPKPVETPPPANPTKPARRTTPAVTPPKAEPSTPAAQPAEPEHAPERAPIQELVPADERKRLQDSAYARKHETRQVLDQARSHRLTSDQKKVVARIQSFIQQSDEAEKHGDARQADALAERALVLAKELSSAW